MEMYSMNKDSQKSVKESKYTASTCVTEDDELIGII